MATINLCFLLVHTDTERKLRALCGKEQDTKPASRHTDRPTSHSAQVNKTDLGLERNTSHKITYNVCFHMGISTH